jgi:hypothetical protein
MERKKMYDSSKVIAGIIIFLLLITLPVWYNASTGQAAYVPELQIDAQFKNCVESKEYMRANHMDLLNDWRDEVVRGESRLYKASDGKEYEKSLTNTCMSCHKDRNEFCVKCHNYAAVKQPKCWDCHQDRNDMLLSNEAQ